MYRILPRKNENNFNKFTFFTFFISSDDGLYDFHDDVWQRNPNEQIIPIKSLIIMFSSQMNAKTKEKRIRTSIKAGKYLHLSVDTR